MSKNFRKVKLENIIKTYLLCKGKKSSSEICDFINNNGFNFNGGVLANEVNFVLRNNNSSVLRNVCCLKEGNKKKYYFKEE